MDVRPDTDDECVDMIAELARQVLEKDKPSLNGEILLEAAMCPLHYYVDQNRLSKALWHREEHRMGIPR